MSLNEVTNGHDDQKLCPAIKPISIIRPVPSKSENVVDSIILCASHYDSHNI